MGRRGGNRHRQNWPTRNGSRVDSGVSAWSMSLWGWGRRGDVVAVLVVCSVSSAGRDRSPLCCRLSWRACSAQRAGDQHGVALDNLLGKR